ncbi:hypothetical protein LCGC14_0818380 [marine sediment metagenome]|uniref:TIR domain-containing protein n=1 Tax=marine sediment metagenome TaxID=412755 RepID=A0A0F9S4J7_9ZZZZ
MVFISPQSVKSKNVRNEINYALNEDKKFVAFYIKETILQSGLRLQMGSIHAIMKFEMLNEDYFRKLINAFHPSIKRERNLYHSKKSKE